MFKRYVLLLLCFVIAIVGIVGLVRRRPPLPRHNGTYRVLLIGDSLPASADAYLHASMQAGGRLRLDDVAQIGTANCDVLTHGQLAGWLSHAHYDALVVAYSGNGGRPCTGRASGDQLYDNYVAAAHQTQQVAARYKLPAIYWVKPPAAALGSRAVLVQQLRHLYGKLGGSGHGYSIDGGHSVSPHNRFVDTLPCTRWEAHTPGRCYAGTVKVRAGDGLHFWCPDNQFVTVSGRLVARPCRGYSGGEMRYAADIATAVRHGWGL